MPSLRSGRHEMEMRVLEEMGKVCIEEKKFILRRRELLSNEAMWYWWGKRIHQPLNNWSKRPLQPDMPTHPSAHLPESFLPWAVAVNVETAAGLTNVAFKNAERKSLRLQKHSFTATNIHFSCFKLNSIKVCSSISSRSNTLFWCWRIPRLRITPSTFV